MLNGLLKDPPQKLKLEKINGALIILFYVSPRFPQQQRVCFFIKSKQEKTSSSKSLVEIHQYVS